jgi:YHS domain-containing protein
MATDPVCGMSVDEKSAPAQTNYRGKTYYFCSKECKASFDADPAKYTKDTSKEAVGSR